MWRIRAKERLYVAGEFATINESAVDVVSPAPPSAAATADVNLMYAPSDGRPYLISNRPGTPVGAHYRWWAWVHLAFVFIGVAAAGYLAAS